MHANKIRVAQETPGRVKQRTELTWQGVRGARIRKRVGIVLTGYTFRWALFSFERRDKTAIICRNVPAVIKEMASRKGSNTQRMSVNDGGAQMMFRHVSFDIL